MKKLFIYLCLFFTCLVIEAQTITDSEQQLYTELLTKNNELHVKAVAQSMFNKNITAIELADIAAEVLAQSIDGNIALGVDTQAWLTKAIGASGSQRYTAFLESIKRSDVSSKLKKYAKKSLRQLSSASEASFVKGEVDLNAIVKSIEGKKQISKSDATKEAFAKVNTGDTINQVFEKLGMPNQVDIVFGSRRQSFVGVISYSMLNFSYEGVGKLNLVFSGKPQKDWVVRQKFSDQMFSGDLNSHPMMKNSPQMVRAYIRELINQASATQLDRDLAAERLYSDLFNEEYTDTLSWACKLLAISGSSRYKKVLENTVTNAPTGKLRKYASKALKKLPSSDDAQYSPGDVFK